MAKKVFVPSTLVHPDAEALLAEADDVELVWGLGEAERREALAPLAPGRRASLQAAMEARLEEALPEVHALQAIGVGGHLWVTQEMIDRAERLEVIFVPGAGFENVDVDAATRRGIAVVNAGGANLTPVSDCVLGLMLSVAMRIGVTDRFHHRERRWRSYAESRVEDGSPVVISGKTLGVIGFGFIGREVVRKCRDGFRMEVLAYDPYVDPVEIARQGATPVASLEELLPLADFVSVNCRLTGETRGIVGARELELMKPTAYLVNTSRGGTVDTDALVAALRGGAIAGAGLDVTEPEPLPDGHPLFELENVVLTPHIAGVSSEFIPQMASSTVVDALRVLRGEQPWHMVNPQAWPALLERRAAVPV